MTAARDQRDTRTSTQPVQKRDGEPTTGEGESPIKSGLRGASFAQGEAMLAPPPGAPPGAPVQRKGAPTGPVQKKPASGAGANVQRDEAVADHVPENVDLRSARVSFTLPAGRKLAGNWKYDASTQHATTVTISVSPGELRVYTSPPLPFDCQWPAANMNFYGASINFASGGVSADFSTSSMGFDMTDTGETEVVNLITRAIAGTPMSRAGYNPMTDRDLMGTVMRVKANFDALPAAGGGGANVSAGDISRPTIGATLAMKTPFFQAADGAGLKIPAGGALDVQIRGTGNLSTILAAGNPQSAAMAAGIQGVTVTSEAIELVRNNETIAKLQGINVAPGGVVTITRFTLEGGLGTGAGVESLLRLLAGGIAMAERGVPLEAGMEITARSGNANPEFVRGLSKQMIEQGLTAAVQGLLRDNRNAIPGIDLALVFGVGA